MGKGKMPVPIGADELEKRTDAAMYGLLMNLKESISAIEWPREGCIGYNVGEFDVTSIMPCSDGEQAWLEVREGDFVCCRVPAYQVAIFYKKPDKVAPVDPQTEDE